MDDFMHGVAGPNTEQQNTEILLQQITALQEKCAGYEAALEHRDAKIVDVIEWIRREKHDVEGQKWQVYADDIRLLTDAQLYDLYLNELREHEQSKTN